MLFWGAAMVLFVSVVLLLSFSNEVAHPGTIKLPDGSYLRIVKISYGTQHSCSFDPRPGSERARAYLASHLPRPLAKYIRLAQPPAIASGQGTNPYLAVFTVRQYAQAKTLVRLRAELVGDRGELMQPPIEAIGVWQAWTNGTVRNLNYWAALQFPAEPKRIFMRFYDSTSSNNKPLAVFSFSNPAPR